MVAPESILPDAFKLDGKGKITCTPSRNPHLDALSGQGAKRHRYVIGTDGLALCSVCHRR